VKYPRHQNPEDGSSYEWLLVILLELAWGTITIENRVWTASPEFIPQLQVDHMEYWPSHQELINVREHLNKLCVELWPQCFQCGREKFIWLCILYNCWQLIVTCIDCYFLVMWHIKQIWISPNVSLVLQITFSCSEWYGIHQGFYFLCNF